MNSSAFASIISSPPLSSSMAFLSLLPSILSSSSWRLVAEAYRLVPKEDDLDVRENDDDDGEGEGEGDGDGNGISAPSKTSFFGFDGANDMSTLATVGGDLLPWMWRGRMEPNSRLHNPFSEPMSTDTFGFLDRRRRSMKSATLKICTAPPLFFFVLPELEVGLRGCGFESMYTLSASEKDGSGCRGGRRPLPEKRQRRS